MFIFNLLKLSNIADAELLFATQCLKPSNPKLKGEEESKIVAGLGLEPRIVPLPERCSPASYLSILFFKKSNENCVGILQVRITFIENIMKIDVGKIFIHT